MHEKVLPQDSTNLLGELESDPGGAMVGWTLAGGTGLALQTGHRVSDDLDFFRTDEFNTGVVHDALSRNGSYETLAESDRSLSVIQKEVRLSFTSVRDPFIFGTIPFRFFDIADMRDIALMKLVAISGRGSRKDFIDLYTILRDGPNLAEYFDLLPRKYGTSRVNTYHILKSLTYFTDAESEPMPKMIDPFDWEECKAFFVREAHAIVLP